MIDRRTQLVAKLVKVGLGRGETLFTEMLIDQVQQLIAAAANLAQIAQESLGDVSWGILEQNLAIADNVIDRRAEVVADFGEGTFAWGVGGRSWNDRRRNCSLRFRRFADFGAAHAKKSE